MKDHLFEENVPGRKLGRWERPQATMTAAGDIQLTPQTWEMLERSEQVVVGFDRATQTIMIRPSDKRERNRQTVIPKYRGRRVRSRTLLEQFGIVLEQTIRFVDARIDEHGRLLLELGTARPAYNGTRVGAFHKERKVPLDRQLPVRPKIAALAADAVTNRHGNRRPDGSRIRVEPPKPPAYHFEESIGLTAIEERVDELLSERLAEFAKKIDTTQSRKSKRTHDNEEGRKRYDVHAFD